MVLPTDPRHTRGTIAGAFRGPVPWRAERFPRQCQGSSLCAWAVDGATNRPTAHRGLSAAPFEGRFPWPKEATLTDFIAFSVAEGSARYRVFREAYFWRAKKKCLGALHARDTHCAVERVAWRSPPELTGRRPGAQPC